VHLILACDGIYDVASTVQIAQASIENRHLSAQDLAGHLVFSAFTSGSFDNLSVLVVKL
jgi:serine/threonine protein phosphatase PrpC